MGRDKRKKPRRSRPEPGPVMPEMGEDYDEILPATADLCQRAGARGFEIGFLHEDVPVEEAAWYASAQFAGTRLIEENHRGPADAAFALAVRVLKGGRCRCGKLVALSKEGAVAYESASLLPGFGSWTVEEATAAGQCLWQREGPRWEPSCDAPPLVMPPGSR
jgi:hypothetical protein